MERAELISKINRLLETQIWEPHEISSLLVQVRSYLIGDESDPLATPAIEIEDGQKISKLTDLVDFIRHGWSLMIENSTNSIRLHLLDEAAKRSYPLHPSISSNSLVEILQNLETCTNSELSSDELAKALSVCKRVMLCCSTWRHEAVCLQIEETLKLSDISWLNPAIVLILSHLEQLEPIPTLVIWSGDAITEFAYVNLPKQRNILSSCFWRTGSIKYGQESLLQDIFCHLLYPQWESQLSNILPKLHLSPAIVGQADSLTRGILKAQLESHPLGSALLRSTVLTNQILQEQDYYVSRLQGKSWEMNRSDYRTRIVAPYLEYLQVSIEDILKISLSDIQQVVWGGKVLESIHLSSLPWASQNFPSARFFSGLALELGIEHILDYPALFV
jgi:hypothetical protein